MCLEYNLTCNKMDFINIKNIIIGYARRCRDCSSNPPCSPHIAIIPSTDVSMPVVCRYHARLHMGGVCVVLEPRRARAPPVGPGCSAGHSARARQGQRRHLRRHHDQLHRSGGVPDGAEPWIFIDDICWIAELCSGCHCAGFCGLSGLLLLNVGQFCDISDEVLSSLTFIEWFSHYIPAVWYLYLLLKAGNF